MVGVAALASCIGPVDGPYTCMSNSDCAFGFRCHPDEHECIAGAAEALGGDCVTQEACEGWACFERWPGGYCTAECLGDGDCPSGSHCGLVASTESAHCLRTCADNSNCRAPSYGCFDGDDDGKRECRPLALGPGGIGDPCIDYTDCGGGTVGRCNDGWNGGYCTRIGCPTVVCPAGSHCGQIDPTNGEGICMGDCASTADCRAPAFDCYDYDIDGSDECAPVGFGTSPVGGPCARLEDCSGGRFAICTRGGGHPGGYCIIGACGAATVCPAGSHCVWEYPVTGGMCMSDCVTDADCRAPYYGCYDNDLDLASVECAPVGIGTGAIGDACAGVADCAGGPYAFCSGPAPWIPNGYCTKDCGAGTGGCPSGSACISTDPPICFDECASSADCRSGYDCYSVDTFTICAPIE